MISPLSLEPLLLALREAGLPVGVAEIDRLRQVFALQPDLAGGEPDQTRRRLKTWLRALLVKSQQDRATFERIYDHWLARAEQDVQFRTRPESPPPPLRSPPSLPSPRSPVVERDRRRWYIAAAILVLVTILVVAWLYPSKPPIIQPVTQPRAVEPPPPPPTTPPTTPAEIRQRSFSGPVASLTVIPSPATWTGWLPLGLGGLALVVAGGLWLFQHRRSWLPEPVIVPLGEGPPRRFPRPPPLSGPQLLDARQQESLVWGIGRFVAEESSRKLDLAATVAATARRGGLLEIRFQRASYQREVWLWLDEAAEDTTLVRLADEVEATLKAHGLVVERALFRGVPEYLVTATGAGFAPREIDERRDLALVAVLTDGRILTRQYAADDRRVRIDALLRDLSHWPRLAFVDFSNGANRLASILGRHELERIAPTQLAAFLGSDRTATVPPRDLPRDDRAWAAACALAPASVDEDTALALRRHLGLATSPWVLRALRAEAPGPAGRLQWSEASRRELLDWLWEAEAPVEGGGVAPNSLLDRALRFWEGIYQRELEKQEHGGGEDTPAHQHLRMEYSLVLLWRQPSTAIISVGPLKAPSPLVGEGWGGGAERISAIEALYALYRQGRLQAVIRQQLERLAPLDKGAKEHIRLPWRWEERSAIERVMLQEMGFGGNMPAETLRRPGRLWLGLGACLGLAVAGGIAAAWSRFIPPAGPPIIEHGTGRPDLAWEHVESVADDRWHVAVVTPKRVVAEEAPAARVRVEWQPQKQPCVEGLSDGAEFWRCGYGETPLRLPETIRHSLVVLVATPQTPAVETLAADLLSGGSADVVLVDPHWPRHRQELLGRQQALRTDQQLLVITTDRVTEEQIKNFFPAGGHGALLQADGWSRLVEGLKQFDDRRSAADTWPGLKVIAGQADRCWLRGVGGCLPKEEPKDENGMAFVRLCPGTFAMGSPESERGRSSDEGPVHEVKVNSFWIGKYEVTQAQFQQFRKDYAYQKGEGDLPAANVTWSDAKDFCEHFGYRLPTEAEWEYAARAGTRTRYSFGDDESKLGEYAWYSENSGDRAHPVGTRQPNPWGLHDMHGNVWEWVQDCWHENYSGAPADGSAWEADKCQQRVLRGGSFIYDRAENLRSANRNWFEPEFRVQGFGFRCARGPRRQP
ncbi:MAG: formylglycine-generating enzyme family protein [Candidatus Competibacter sp.]|nr:formylglycine-generating enzyme family protein [Candidatus Competibacter sp.]